MIIDRKDKKYNIIKENDYNIHVNKSVNRAIFTPYWRGKWNSFLYDFTNSKCFTFDKNPRNYTILDISIDGKYVILSYIAEGKNSKLKIVEVETGSSIFENEEFYAYEAYFTSNIRYIFCRSRQYGNIKTFIYDIINKQVAYELTSNIFIFDGDFSGDRTTFVYSPDRNSNSIKFLDFSSLSEYKVDVDYIDMNIWRIFYYKNNHFIFMDSLNTITNYCNNKILWRTKTHEFLPKYSGSIFFMPKYGTLYFDTPLNINNKFESKESDTILYGLDIYNGSLLSISLPKDIQYKRFTPISDTKIIDSSGNIYDLKTKEETSFPLKQYR